MIDVVAVLDANLSQVFERARPVKATVKEESKPMEHPLETGAIITDHRIILPVEIELSMVLPAPDYVATYQEVRTLFLSGQLLTVQTRTASYANMLIASIPHEESPDTIDAITLALTLKEAQFVDVQFSAFKVRHPHDSRTVKRGQQQGTDGSQKKSSILASLFK